MIRPHNFIQVLIILLPAGRLLTLPLPPTDFDARVFAAVILPPLLIFAILITPLILCHSTSLILESFAILTELSIKPLSDFQDSHQSQGYNS